MKSSSLETERIMGSLKRLMRSRGVTYAQLAALIGLSEPTVKRIFSRSTLSLSRLDQICQALDTSIQEMSRLSSETTEVSETLSIEQEESLAADANLLACYYLVSNGRAGKEIAVELGADEKQVRKWFIALHALRLVELKEGLRAHARTTSAVRWRRDGPVRRLYERQVRTEFLQSAFSATGESLHFRSAELSVASCNVLLRRLERLVSEFRDLAELDRRLPSSAKRNLGMLLAVRPWVFSMFDSLRSR